MVFDDFPPAASSTSLINILVKGKNNMNELVEIALRLLTYSCAFYTDIKKMYNTVQSKY